MLDQTQKKITEKEALALFNIALAQLHSMTYKELRKQFIEQKVEIETDLSLSSNQEQPALTKKLNRLSQAHECLAQLKFKKSPQKQNIIYIDSSGNRRREEYIGEQDFEETKKEYESFVENKYKNLPIEDKKELKPMIYNNSAEFMNSDCYKKFSDQIKTAMPDMFEGSNKNYGITVLSFKSLDDAKEFQARLKDKGMLIPTPKPSTYKQAQVKDEEKQQEHRSLRTPSLSSAY